MGEEFTKNFDDVGVGFERTVKFYKHTGIEPNNPAIVV